MSKLGEDGQWRRHWFVLGHSALKYYQDSDTEESDGLEGEIELTTCVNVSDCNLDKNYGIQIHTNRAVFTLSATTSRVRKHWVKVLRQAVLKHPSADRHVTRQSESSSEKENPSRRTSLPCQLPSRLTCEDCVSRETATAVSVAASSRSTDLHQTDSVDQDPDAATPSDLSATRREAGEGWDRDQAKRLEERNKWFEEGVSFGEMGSRWDAMELKRGSASVPVAQTASEVSRKWAEIERLSPREMSAQSVIGAQAERRTLIGEQTGNGNDLGDAQTDRQSPIDGQSNGHNLLSSHTERPSQNDSQYKRQNRIGGHTNSSMTAEALQEEVGGSLYMD
ncbi:TRIO and F-actin-binding protein-like [Aplochiton taeniatus]